MSFNSMNIEGVIVSGTHGAHRSIKRQKEPFYERGLQEIHKFVDGTLNIDIGPYTKEFIQYDYFFKSVEHKKFPRRKTEDFGFIIIESITYRGTVYTNPGFIYVPHSSPHFTEPTILEILAIPIIFASCGEPIDLQIPDNRLRLNNKF